MGLTFSSASKAFTHLATSSGVSNSTVYAALRLMRFHSALNSALSKLAFSGLVLALRSSLTDGNWDSLNTLSIKLTTWSAYTANSAGNSAS
ncbi:MAG: hypothetical protein ACD_23C00719G0001 [uncultured bacterium]|nr:MAG: hypothetical protein ACD_23C00719G0001 [uncultured bacterium]